MRSGLKLKAITLSPGRILRLLADERGLDELVGLAALVGVATRPPRRCRRMMRRPAVNEHVVGALGALPAAVAVHRPVAPDDGAHARTGGRTVELRQIPRACVRQRVAPVGERVHDQILDLQLAGDLDQGAQVIERGVHAAVGDEPDQVHRAGCRPRLADERAPAGRRSRPASRRRSRRRCARGPGGRRRPRRGSGARPRCCPSARRAGPPPDRRPRASYAGTSPRARRTPACGRARRRCRVPAPPIPSRRARSGIRSARAGLRSAGESIIAAAALHDRARTTRPEARRRPRARRRRP